MHSFGSESGLAPETDVIRAKKINVQDAYYFPSGSAFVQQAPANVTDVSPGTRNFHAMNNVSDYFCGVFDDELTNVRHTMDNISDTNYSGVKQAMNNDIDTNYSCGNELTNVRRGDWINALSTQRSTSKSYCNVNAQHSESEGRNASLPFQQQPAMGNFDASSDQSFGFWR